MIEEYEFDGCQGRAFLRTDAGPSYWMQPFDLEPDVTVEQRKKGQGS